MPIYGLWHLPGRFDAVVVPVAADDDDDCDVGADVNILISPSSSFSSPLHDKTDPR